MIEAVDIRSLFQLRDHAPRVHLVLVLLPLAEEVVESEKEDSSLKTCHDREATKMAEQKMVRKNKIPMATQLGKTAARAHTIRGKILSLKVSGVREISMEIDAVGATVKEKTNTWNRSVKESVKRETELYKVVEAAVMDEKQQQKGGGMIRELLEQLQKRGEEENEARGLIEEMQRNLDEAQNRSYEVERKLDRVLWAYIEAMARSVQ